MHVELPGNPMKNRQNQQGFCVKQTLQPKQACFISSCFMMMVVCTTPCFLVTALWGSKLTVKYCRVPRDHKLPYHLTQEAKIRVYDLVLILFCTSTLAPRKSSFAASFPLFSPVCSFLRYFAVRIDSSGCNCVPFYIYIYPSC